MRSQEKSVLPRFVSPPTVLFLWTVLGLLIVGLAAAWLARVPVYSSGPAFVVDWPREVQPPRAGVVVVALLPPRDLARLRVGQDLFLHLDETGERSRISIIAVEPEIQSPDAVRRRLALDAYAAGAITQPSAVVVARFEPIAPGLPDSTYRGSVCRADVEVGSCRVISLLPLVGQFFGA
jgi:hypothetical protein